MKRYIVTILFLSSFLFAVDLHDPFPSAAPNGRIPDLSCRLPSQGAYLSNAFTDAERTLVNGVMTTVCNSAASGYNVWSWNYKYGFWQIRRAISGSSTTSDTPSGYACGGGGYYLSLDTTPTCPDGELLNPETCECESDVPSCVSPMILNSTNDGCVYDPAECLDPFSVINNTCVYDPNNDGIEDPEPKCSYPNNLCWRALSKDPLGEIVCSTSCPTENGSLSEPFYSPDECHLPNFWLETNGKLSCVASDSKTPVAPDGNTPYTFSDLNLTGVGSSPVPEVIENCHVCSDYDFTVNGGCFFNSFGGCDCTRTGQQPCPLRDPVLDPDPNPDNTALQDRHASEQATANAKQDTASLNKLVALTEDSNQYLDSIDNGVEGLNNKLGSLNGSLSDLNDSLNNIESTLSQEGTFEDPSSFASDDSSLIDSVVEGYENMRSQADASMTQIEETKNIIENGFQISAVKSRPSNCPIDQHFSLGEGTSINTQVDYCESLGNFYDTGYLLTYVSTVAASIGFIIFLVMGL